MLAVPVNGKSRLLVGTRPSLHEFVAHFSLRTTGWDLNSRHWVALPGNQAFVSTPERVPGLLQPEPLCFECFCCRLPLSEDCCAT